MGRALEETEGERQRVSSPVCFGWSGRGARAKARASCEKGCLYMPPFSSYQEGEEARLTDERAGRGVGGERRGWGRRGWGRRGWGKEREREDNSPRLPSGCCRRCCSAHDPQGPKLCWLLRSWNSNFASQHPSLSPKKVASDQPIQSRVQHEVMFTSCPWLLWTS